MADATLHQPDRPAARWGLPVILVLATVARLAALLLWEHRDDLPDVLTYRTAAENLLASGMIANHTSMPGYPVFRLLTGNGWFSGIADLAVGVLGVWLVHALALRLCRDPVAALLAALGWALYPFALFYAVVGLTENLFVALMLGAFVVLYDRRYLLGAILLVLATLTRSSNELLAPILVLAFAILVHREPWTRVLRAIVIYGAVHLALFAPWWAHNTVKYDAFVRTNLATGIVLYSGNNPANRTGGGVNANDGSTTDQDYSPFTHLTDPIARDRALTESAIDYIAADPAHFAAMAWVKFLRTWRLTPFAAGYQSTWIVLASALSYGPVLLLALVYLAGWGWRQFWRLSPILGFIAFTALVPMITIGSIRYRFPAEPLLVIFAAMAIWLLWTRFAHRRMGQKAARGGVP